MPAYRVGDYLMHVRMTSTRKHPAPAPCCAPFEWPRNLGVGRCRAMSTKLCDAPVGDATCDMPICPEHATSIGPDRDLCPKHAAERRPSSPARITQAQLDEVMTTTRPSTPERAAAVDRLYSEESANAPPGSEP